MTTETKEPTQPTQQEQTRVPFTMETLKGQMFQTIDPNGNTIGESGTVNQPYRSIRPKR